MGAGELFYYVGSHKLPDFLFGGKYKTIYDCLRINGGKLPEGEGAEFVRSLERQARERDLSRQVFPALRGDVLVWHADLVHGGNPISKEITRKSIVTHYCPVRLAPLYFEGHEQQCTNIEAAATILRIGSMPIASQAFRLCWRSIRVGNKLLCSAAIRAKSP